MSARPKRRRVDAGTVLVVGLGRFGSAVAESLMRQHVEVLAVDEDPKLVQRYADELTLTVQADSTDGEAMRQLGVDQLSRAVVAIGSDIEASVLTVITLVEAGVEQVYAKAITRKHGKILSSIGAHHVIYPEQVMGQRVAHMVTGGVKDYLEFEDGFAMIRTDAPRQMWGVSLAEARLRSKHHVTVVGIKRGQEEFSYAVPETVAQEGDELVVSGATEDVERFSGL